MVERDSYLFVSETMFSHRWINMNSLTGCEFFVVPIESPLISDPDFAVTR